MTKLTVAFRNFVFVVVSDYLYNGTATSVCYEYKIDNTVIDIF